MNQTHLPVSSSAVPWPTSDQRERSADAAVPQRNETPPPESAVLVMNAGQGSRDSKEHMGESARRNMDESLEAADEALQASVHRLRESRSEWVNSLRVTVRRNPLASVAAAFALGATIFRIAR